MKWIIGYLFDGEKYHPIHMWRPKNPEHGDFSTDAAIVLAKLINRNVK